MFLQNEFEILSLFQKLSYSIKLVQYNIWWVSMVDADVVVL